MAPGGGRVGAVQNGSACTCIPVQESEPYTCMKCSGIIQEESQIPSPDKQQLITGFTRPYTVVPGTLVKQDVAISTKGRTWNKLTHTSGYVTASDVLEYAENLSIEPVTIEENSDIDLVPPQDEPTEGTANKTTTNGAAMQTFVPGTTSSTHVDALKSRSEPVYQQTPILKPAKAQKTDREDSTGKPPTASTCSVEGYKDATEESSIYNPPPYESDLMHVHTKDEYHGYDGPYPLFFKSNVEIESQDLHLEPPSTSRGISHQTPPQTPPHIKQVQFFTFAGEISADSGFLSASTSSGVNQLKYM